jgi:hypothetical protein
VPVEENRGGEGRQRSVEVAAAAGELTHGEDTPALLQLDGGHALEPLEASVKTNNEGSGKTCAGGGHGGGAIDRHRSTCRGGARVPLESGGALAACALRYCIACSRSRTTLDVGSSHGR